MVSTRCYLGSPARHGSCTGGGICELTIVRVGQLPQLATTVLPADVLPRVRLPPLAETIATALVRPLLCHQLEPLARRQWWRFGFVVLRLTEMEL